MGPAVYILSALVTALCAALLLRGYLRVKQKLLLWSSLCFICLCISDVLVFFDLVIYPGPQVDLYPWRLLAAAIGMLLLLYGLIWESE